jgi:hypothetical protein
MIMKLCPDCDAAYKGSVDELNHLMCEALCALVTANADPEWFNKNPHKNWQGTASTEPMTFTRDELKMLMWNAAQAAVDFLQNREMKNP